MNKSPRLKSLIIVVWSCTLSIHILIFFIFAVVLTAVEQKITPSVFTALRLALIICCQQSNSRICLLVTSSKGFFHLFFAPPPSPPPPPHAGRDWLTTEPSKKPTDYMCWLSTARGQCNGNACSNTGDP